MGSDKCESSEIPDLTTCGVNYTPWPNPNKVVKNVTKSDDGCDEQFGATTTELYTLAGVFLACSILSALVVAKFVDPLSK